ncbi:MAG TPA: FAD binding domain-containing protein [candidate division Zixibacteria bacterium]|nr:FAD binding domain-containing protein [candidate division Zixibacteria bacterium]
MYVPHFEYLRPVTLDAALATLAERGAGVRPLAGGTDLLLSMKEGKSRPQALLSLQDIPELHTITFSDGRVQVGAAVTIGELTGEDLVKENAALGDLRRVFASAPIRNLATVGGNICNAAACADSPPILLVNDAELTIAGAGRQRSVSLAEFITGPRATALAADELLVSLTFGARNPGSAYIKFGSRQAVNIAIVGVACALELTGSVVSRAVVAVTAASPKPLLYDAESARGAKPSRELWDSIAADVAERLAPISDLRGSADYRLQLARVGTVRGFERSLERLEGLSHA